MRSTVSFLSGVEDGSRCVPHMDSWVAIITADVLVRDSDVITCDPYNKVYFKNDPGPL